MVDELGEIIRVTEGGREIEITKARAIAREIIRLAIAGDLRAATTVLSFTRGQSETDDPDESTSRDLEVKDNFVDRELRRRAENAPRKSNPQPKENGNEQ